MSQGTASQAADLSGTPRDGGLAGAIDLDHLGHHTFGNQALRHEVLSLFARQAELLGARLREQGEAAELARVVHTLKGSARAIGAWRVVGEAEAVEAVLRTGQAADLVGLREALGEARDVIAMLLDAG